MELYGCNAGNPLALFLKILGSCARCNGRMAGIENTRFTYC